MDYTLNLPKRVDLLQNPSNQLHPLIIQGSLKLLACRVLGNSMLQQGFQKRLQSSYQQRRDKYNLSAGRSRWCGEREIDSVSCNIQPFLDFLADLYHGQGLQYQSINLIHSAVSMTHKNNEAAPIGQHPLMSRLMRGIYNSRPPTPQY